MIYRVELDRKELEQEIQGNCEGPNHSETYLHLPTGTFVHEFQNRFFPPIPDDGALIPIPAIDPEGSGEQGERFEEFCDAQKPDEVLSKDAVEDESGVCMGWEDYLVWVVDEGGWNDAAEEWEEYEQAHIDYVIDEWVSNAANGNYDAYVISEATFPPCIITLKTRQVLLDSLPDECLHCKKPLAVVPVGNTHAVCVKCKAQYRGVDIKGAQWWETENPF